MCKHVKAGLLTGSSDCRYCVLPGLSLSTGNVSCSVDCELSIVVAISHEIVSLNLYVCYSVCVARKDRIQRVVPVVQQFRSVPQKHADMVI